MLLIITAIVFYIALAVHCVIKRSSVTRKDNGDTTEKLSGKILVVISHPDDETMFFGPTIYKLAANCDNRIHLLCLSTGNHYGQGDTRKKELLNAAKCLNVDHVKIVDHEKLKDGQDWDKQLVNKIVLDYAEENSISSIITFDSYGIR
ncbi:N-acetylglucosaminyl-phosphatidylinositol de-N-acetylase [Halotydeus destructor]|nr:N-acetylglucosaminyl-phosphatidylinositol de-N-acetylase [Halotydeus destructor]